MEEKSLSQERKTRKEEIQEAFIKLYSGKDIQLITVSEICKNAHLSRTAFYHYYSDVYELLQEMLDQCLNDLKELNSDFYLTDLKTLNENSACMLTLNYIRDHKIEFKALMRHGGTNDFIYRWKKIIMEDFRKKYYYHNKDLGKQEIIMVLTASAIIGLYDYWLYHMDEISTDEICNGILQLLCHTLM